MPLPALFMGGIRAGSMVGRAAWKAHRYAQGARMYFQMRRTVSGYFKRKPSGGRGTADSVDVEISGQLTDIRKSLDNFEGNVRKYALERSFKDIERELAARTIQAFRSVPRKGKKKSKKAAESTPGWIRMRSALKKGSFKALTRVTGDGRFSLQQSISKVPVHWIEYGTHGGEGWPGYPQGSGPRYKTADRMRREIVRKVSANLRKQVEAHRATGKLKSVKELRV